MKLKIISSIFILFLFLGFISTVNAAPNNNPLFATIEEVEQLISDASDYLQGQIDSLVSDLDNAESNISSLDGRVADLENAQVPDPLDVIFFNNVDILTTTSQYSDWFDSNNYSELVLTYQCRGYAPTSEYGASLSLLVSNDKITSATVFTASKAECHSGGSTTVDVGGKYYQVVVGNNTNLVNPPMTAYVAGRFR